MKLLQFYEAGEIRLGVKLERGVVDLEAAGFVPSFQKVIQDGSILKKLRDFIAALPETGVWLKDEAKLALAPCIPAPEKILCVGLNYFAHAKETGGAIPETAIMFSKFNNSLAGANEDVPLPASVEQADYEVELGVVLGKTARNVSVEEALDTVFGYCTVNDLSARDWQFRSSQWLLGKTSDKFLPCGAYLVTADEVPNPQNLSLKTWVNGEQRQGSNTADMIFNVAQVISYLSQVMTLKAGDIISTGTPAGVILGMPQPRPWLKAGDVVEVEVEGLGRCKNRMVASQ